MCFNSLNVSKMLDKTLYFFIDIPKKLFFEIAVINATLFTPNKICQFDLVKWIAHARPNQPRRGTPFLPRSQPWLALPEVALVPLLANISPEQI